ncbi:MAG TPA: fibronectin type III domain-containing protein [Parafilimonas sp.]|nr:fibronectin type III domain-containing protein [Parafilimonas sp.]
MKSFYALTFFLALQICIQATLSAQSVLNPSDPVINYNPSNPPVEPPFGKIGKWVRTRGLAWNTDSYKAYIYEGACFRLKFPKTYNPTANDGKKYPLAILFHGAGEAGPITDNEKHLYHGGQPYMYAVDSGKFDGYVLFMQSQGTWGITSYTKIIDIINYMIINNKLDPFSVSVNGLSSGGQASWDMVLNYPNYVTASLPMSNNSIGYRDADVVNKVKFTAIWNFQGGLDGSPSPYTSQQVRDAMVAAGGKYTYTEYSGIGHGVWDSAFAEPDFFPLMVRGYSSNPWPLFGRTGFCPNDPINVTIGVPPGFDEYQWRKNKEVISGAGNNSLNVTSVGVYDARVRRGTIWSDWSRIPVSIHITPPTVTPPITVSGLMSNVLVSGDGKNYVNLEVPDKGYTSYKWKKLGSDSVLDTQRIYTATQPGKYTVSVTEKYGCSSIPSPVFTVINANGPNGPDAATNLYAATISSTEIALSWQNNPHPVNNETFFEIYRGLSKNGVYNFVGKVPADNSEFKDSKLSPGVTYFYKIRAVNDNGAAPMSNIASVSTSIDKTPPSPPDNLRILYSTNSSISIQWESSTDNVGIQKYNVYVNGANNYSTSDNKFIVSGLQKGKQYSIYVKAVDSSGNNSEQSNIVNSLAVLNGLVYKYYEGNWTAVPDFSALVPLAVGVSPNINLGVAKRKVQFGFLWQGYLNVPISGYYRIGTTSDDGSQLWLGKYDPSQPPLLDNNHLRNRTRTVRKFLDKGVYPITISYFQHTKDTTLQLFWINSDLYGDTLRHQIEDKYFTGGTLPADSIPVKPSGINGSVIAYNKIKLSWSDKSKNETGFQIYRSLRASKGYQIVHTTASNETQYIDSALSSQTKYFYKINAVNSYGTSAFTDSLPITTVKAPKRPAPPSDLDAISLSSSSIKLVWSDVDTTETNYQVFRSMSDSSHFAVAALLPANSTTFTDTGLYGNTYYYYRVYALRGNTSSIDRKPKKAITKNNNPVINNKFTQKFVRYGVQTVIQLAATDLDADPINFYAFSLPPFVTLVNNNNGTANLICNPTSLQAGNYDNIKIFAKDTLGGTDSNIFKLTVNNNYDPTINNISNYTLDEGDSFSVSLTANDQNAGDILTWSVAGLPNNYSLIPNGNGKVNLVLKPGYAAAGVYTALVTVTDGNGGTATKQFMLTVNDKDPNLIVYLRFKDVSSQGTPWNDITSVNSSNFKDNLNRSTGIGLAMQTSWWATWHEGPRTGNNSGIYPDNVTGDYYYFGAFGGPETVTSKFTGLDPSKVYSISFYSGSVWIGAPNNGSTVFTINSQAKSLNVQNNTATTADFNNLSPAADGTISFTMSKGPNTPAGYINAIVIKSLYADSEKPAAPANLAASIASGGVQLSWRDVAYNELNYHVYRAPSATGPFSVIKSYLPFNTTSYLDTTAGGNTQYFYLVKASNAQGLSDSSNIVSITTIDRAPRIQPIANITIKNNQQITLNVTAKDDITDHITLTADNLPSFVTFTDNGNGNGLLTISPSSGITGTFENITLRATDNSDSINTTSFNITVTDQNLNSVYINFSDGSLAPDPWNNFTLWPTSGTTLTNLYDDNDSLTSVSLKLLNGFQGTIAGGMQPGNGKGVYPEVVMRTSIYEGSSKTDSIQVSGLNKSLKYNFVFFGSHDDGLKGKTNFAVGSQTVTLDAAYNINKTVQINSIIPDVNGQVVIKVSKVPGEDFAYLNALIIQSYDSTLKLLAPSDLRVTAVTKATVALQWSDRSFDETGFEIWKTDESSGSNYSLLKTVPANVTSFVDSNLIPGQTYYYTVRAIKTGLQSAFVNAVSATTYSQVIYVNFTSINNASVPWNNTSALPEPGLKWNNFLEDTGVPSSISMEETSHFAGLYGAGMNTGTDSGIFPDKVLIDSYGLFTGETGSMKVTGLSLNKKYDFTFFASSQASGDVNVAYTVNGRKVVLNASLNTRGTVTLYNVVADKNGEAFITIAANTKSSQFGLLGALVIQEYDGSDKNIPTPQQALKADIQASGISKAATAPTVSNTKNKAAVYPNPFGRDFTMSLSIQQADDVQAELYSINGKLILRRNLGHVSPGSYNFKFLNDQVIAPGIYMLKIIYVNSGHTNQIKVLKQ